MSSSTVAYRYYQQKPCKIKLKIPVILTTNQKMADMADTNINFDMQIPHSLIVYRPTHERNTHLL